MAKIPFVENPVVYTKIFFILMFILSSFMLSTGGGLKLYSINIAAVVAMFMFGLFIIEVIVCGGFDFKIHEIKEYLWWFFVWAFVSLIISKVTFSKLIPLEAYSYSWATGLNYPDVRGWVFLLRLFLVIFAIDFIIININTKRLLFFVINFFLIAYSLVCFFGIFQLILFGLFGIKVGSIYIDPYHSDYFRIGGYVGEPQTFALVLLNGYFVTLAAIKYRCNELWFSNRFLRIIFFVASISLIATLSLMALIGVVLGLIVNLKNFTSKNILIGLLVFIISVFVFFEPFNSLVFSKIFSGFFTVTERTITWMLGGKMFVNNILSGVGIGQSPLVNSLYVSEYFWSKFNNILIFREFRQPPMNSYIELAAETGVIGVAILGYVFYKVYKAKFRKGDVFSNFIKYGYGSTLFVLAVAANSSSGIFYTGMFSLSLAMFWVGNMLANQ